MKWRVIAGIVLALWSFAGFSASAEPDSLQVKNPRILSFRTHYGFIIPHSRSIEEVSYSHPRGFQIEYARHLNSQAVWDYFGSYPRVGLSFSYTNFDNAEILGSGYSLIAYFEPFVTFKNRLNPTFRLGAGISYLDNVYDPEKNPLNLFYSSPVSFYLSANVGFNYRLNNHIDLNVTGNYSHISNGRMKLPNKGINFPTIMFGMDYKIDPLILEDRVRQLSKTDIHGKLWKFGGAFYTSKKDVVERGPKYQVYGLELYGGRILSRISALNLGLEVCYDRSLREKERTDASTEYNPVSYAGFLRHDALMGRFIFEQAIGIYFNKPSPDLQRLYQRIGLRYALNSFLDIGVSLKTHTSTADFVNVKMGVRW